MFTLLVGLALCARAASESFDVVTFTVPPGQRSEGRDHVGFTESTPRTFCTVAVYRSTASSGDPGQDFAAEWNELVAQRYRVVGELKTETAQWPASRGWTLTMGAAMVHAPQQGQFVALLNVYSGHGKRVSVPVLYNDNGCRPASDKFIAGVRLAAPSAAAASAPATLRTTSNTVAASATRLVGVWSSFRAPANGQTISSAQIAQAGFGSWWQFRADGTYRQVRAFGRGPTSWDGSVDEGHWSLDGDALTIQQRTRSPLSVLEDPASLRTTPQWFKAVTYRVRFGAGGELLLSDPPVDYTLAPVR